MIWYILGFGGFALFCAISTAVYSSYYEKLILAKNYNINTLSSRLLSIALLICIFLSLLYHWMLAVVFTCYLLLVVMRVSKIGLPNAILVSFFQPFSLITYSFHGSGKVTSMMGSSFGGPMGSIPSQLAEQKAEETKVKNEKNK